MTINKHWMARIYTSLAAKLFYEDKAQTQELVNKALECNPDEELALGLNHALQLCRRRGTPLTLVKEGDKDV